MLYSETLTPSPDDRSKSPAAETNWVSQWRNNFGMVLRHFLVEFRVIAHRTGKHLTCIGRYLRGCHQRRGLTLQIAGHPQADAKHLPSGVAVADVQHSLFTLEQDLQELRKKLMPESNNDALRIGAGYVGILVLVLTGFNGLSTLMSAKDNEGHAAKPIAVLIEEPAATGTSDEPQQTSDKPNVAREFPDHSVTSDRRMTDVHEADRLLSHPQDPLKKAAGVVMNKIQPNHALSVVRKAVRDYPESRRFFYQLGRAQDAAGNGTQALAAYHRAAELGYPMAFYNLAYLYQSGRHTKVDAEKAKQYCQQAAKAGVEPAKEMLRNFEFRTDGYSNPELFRRIYDRTLDEVTYDDSALASCLQPFLEPFFETKGLRPPISRSAYVRVAKQTTTRSLGQFLAGLAQSQGRRGAARFEPSTNVSLELVGSLQNGRADAQLFFDRHGCDSAIAEKFFGNVEYYINRLKTSSFEDEVRKGYGK